MLNGMLSFGVPGPAEMVILLLLFAVVIVLPVVVICLIIYAVWVKNRNKKLNMEVNHLRNQNNQ